MVATLGHPKPSGLKGVGMMDEKASQENRILAALGYPIWIIALVVLLTDMKQNRFMRFHAIQALGYAVAWVVIYLGLSIITSFSFMWRLYFLWPMFELAWLVIAIYYASRAYRGETFDIPLVSQFTARYTAT
jgi:uncharacterized membrane protein